MLLGYIILGKTWIGDSDLKKKYEDYEVWLGTRENSGQVPIGVQANIDYQVVHHAQAEQFCQIQGK